MFEGLKEPTDPMCLCCGKKALLNIYELRERPGHMSLICAHCAIDIYTSARASAISIELDEVVKYKQKLQRLYAKPEAEWTKADVAESARIMGRLKQFKNDADFNPDTMYENR